MDATAPTEMDTDYNKVCEFILKIDSNFPNSLKPKSTVVKYTKLPDFDFDSKATWSQDSYVLQPRLRRIIEIDNSKFNTSRSLKPELNAKSHSSYTKRKVVSITEDNESDLHPRFSQSVNKVKNTNRAAGPDEKIPSVRTTSRLSVSSKCSRETKSNAKTINKNDTNLAKISYVNNVKNRNCTEKDMTLPRNLNEKGKDVSTKRKIVNTSPAKTTSNKSIISRVRQKSPTKSKVTIQKEAQVLRNKPVTVIHVPIDVKPEREVIPPPPSVDYLNLTPATTDRCTTVDLMIHTRDANVATDIKSTENKITETDNFFIDYCKDVDIQTEKITKVYDNLDIPNVTLLKERSDISKYDVVNLSSNSLPNLKIPSIKIASHKTEGEFEETERFGSPPYIIGRATVTYTTKQKFDFHVVSGSKENSPESTPSHLVYPMNVLSMFKKEIGNVNSKKNIEDNNEERHSEKNHTTNYFNCLNKLKTVNCSYVFNSHKLVKPSHLISEIRVNKEYICEQFQRELNFIDSFFESLQYLESCSFSDKCLATNGKTWFKKAGLNIKDADYNSFLQKFEHGADDDNETIASKSLCLLNLLIRDEQRRAKNLLFVLKLREDALKDFTKSQILWLENKKKQDNKGISTLKKKQRGALLKLQHECGEMQRMRKTLLSLSEKRKAALMKTKKNIELKLRNSVDVEQILFGKKKLKRNTMSERNIAPLKCFDLSSSECEESMSSRPKSETSILTLEASAAVKAVTSAEKCVQTGDSIIGCASLVDRATETAAENFIVVDGGYLNIIFQNLTLPQIFSNGKQYEVNEEALKNIVNTTNKQNISFGDEFVKEKLMDQLKNCDEENSTSPSTARSLVDELDQYYKSLVDEKSPKDSTIEREYEKPAVLEVEDDSVQIEEEIQLNKCEKENDVATTMSVPTNVFDKSVEMEKVSEETLTVKGKQVAAVGSQTLPASDIEKSEVPIRVTKSQQSSTSTFTVSESGTDSSQIPQVMSSTSSMAAPSHSEAEELRRQQLAIEREIKALEQQQCQLLVVREIPDKPPPPYTPPTLLTEVKPKTKRLFKLDEATEQKVPTYVDPTTPVDLTDPFEVFVKDFVEESTARHKVVQSDKPWDACNILPKKREQDQDKIWNETKVELKSVLSGVTPCAAVSGVSSRRSDHIDDILFDEWRRCEPEWTSLHADELTVKSQVFESIFQKILTETIDEYKKNVLSPDKDATE